LIEINADCSKDQYLWGAGGSTQSVKPAEIWLPAFYLLTIKGQRAMKILQKQTLLLARGLFALVTALPFVMSPFAHAQDIARLNPIPPPPGKAVVSNGLVARHQAPTGYTDWLPARVVWSNNLLRDVAKECSSFVGKYDQRFRISKEDPRDYGTCVLQLYDAVGSLRTIENWNPHFRPRSKRGQELKVYMVHEYGTRRFGVFELSELNHSITAIN
jgi:hypothetical protein